MFSPVHLTALFLVLVLLNCSNGLAFTLAFHIPVTPKTQSNLNRFLLAIYHPENLYLITPTAPLPPLPATLQQSKNIITRAPTRPPTPHGVTEALSVISFYSFFLDRSDYFRIPPPNFYLQTTPSEHPLLSPNATRNALTLLPSPTFLSLSETPHPHSPILPPPPPQTLLHYDPLLVFTHNTSALCIATTNSHPDADQSPNPLSLSHDIFHIASATLARAASHSMASKRLLLRVAEVPDAARYFFATLAERDAANFVVPTTSLHCTAESVRRGSDAVLPCLFAAGAVTDEVRDVLDARAVTTEGYAEAVQGAIKKEVDAALEFAGERGYDPDAEPLL